MALTASKQITCVVTLAENCLSQHKYEKTFMNAEISF